MGTRLLFGLLAVILVTSFICSNAESKVERSAFASGKSECIDCAEKNELAYQGLQVAIKCKTNNGDYELKTSGKLDKNGDYRVQLPTELIGENGDLKQECFAQLHSVSNAPCPDKNGLNPHKLILKSREDGVHTFSTDAKLPFLSTTCQSAFFWTHHKFTPLPKPDPFHKPLPKFPSPPSKLPPKPHYYPPIYKKPLPPSIPIYKKPLPPSIPIYKPPVPIYKPPVPVKKPVPHFPPIYKKPLPHFPPIYKKPVPHFPPIYKKPLPHFPQVYGKPLPHFPPIYKKPLPHFPPIYKKPLPHFPPIYKKPLPHFPPIYKKPLPQFPPIYHKPLPPLHKFPPTYKKPPHA
ncbi:uncharacterized protein A4U43_C04F8290 [Asparagus officinalis]|uniref:Proline-rich protein n=1 Tax=Asparagus officinalis TaxID=4686 RepID=A0A5P1F113_ASPOF|nr:repetitive proline-rich cell wall protein-like [Asparagus officinalis]ONK71413.1 uncharacterized protein A4U43_C04F8290 [Asparagus officinalis]